MSFQLLTIHTDQGHIFKVLVFSQLSKGTFDILLEVIPLETKFLGHPAGLLAEDELKIKDIFAMFAILFNFCHSGIFFVVLS